MLARRAVHAAVLGARKLLWGTPISRLAVTERLYRAAIRAMYGSGEREALYKGHRLTVPCADATIVPGILGGYYESLELDIFAEACRDAATVLDVGANLGLYAVHAARHARPGAQVHCFEPVPANVERLRRNLAANGATAIVHEAAVGARPGSLDLFLARHNVGTHSASAELSGGAVRCTVPMITVDGVAADLPRVDILKIDIEGYDGYALRGAAGTIERDRPTLFLEYSPRALRACGFDPADFAGPLRGYAYCLAVDEIGRTVHVLDVDGLDDVPARAANLVVTDDADLVGRALALAGSARKVDTPITR
ncbi:FkbM family methyltransferase [Hamadaea tsunoensis]|uniref:FkbM family methyltransferase n=1 Tax=Hamadaea tsunoensis TaxID=53368 RepID=UPI000406577D|nr:FkbM family methyltransferase [Hamadaea tsunoensis]